MMLSCRIAYGAVPLVRCFFYFLLKLDATIPSFLSRPVPSRFVPFRLKVRHLNIVCCCCTKHNSFFFFFFLCSRLVEFGRRRSRTTTTTITITWKETRQQQRNIHANGSHHKIETGTCSCSSSSQLSSLVVVFFFRFFYSTRLRIALHCQLYSAVRQLPFLILIFLFLVKRLKTKVVVQVQKLASCRRSTHNSSFSFYFLFFFFLSKCDSRQFFLLICSFFFFFSVVSCIVPADFSVCCSATGSTASGTVRFERSNQSTGGHHHGCPFGFVPPRRRPQHGLASSLQRSGQFQSPVQSKDAQQIQSLVGCQ